MGFKNFVGDLFGFNSEIEKLISERNYFELNLINVQKVLKQKEEEFKNFEIALSNLKKELIELKIENEKLNNIVFESDVEKFWNNKYPKVNVGYAGRTFGNSNEMIPIDVRLLITPQDFNIHEILKKNKLYLKDNNNNVDETVIKIYKFIKNNFYKYLLDVNNYGLTEFWEFPFEIIEKKKRNVNHGFDCDSWANFMASFYIASGVPSWKVRVVVGNCQLGGHSTVYVHSDDDNKFHHLNSTYGNKWSKFEKISDYPVTDDALDSDSLGIKDVWFSFNNLYSWNKFSSEASKQFKKNNDFVI